MKISMIGSGYVGLVAGACLADFGNMVICIDKDADKIEALNRGEVPIYEPGLEDLLIRNVNEGRLRFSTELHASVKSSEVVFIAVGTPPNQDGSADLSHVLEVAEEIGKALDKYIVIVDKSTVPVGTAALVKDTIQHELNARQVALDFDVVSNPEFLREGSAIHDFTHPDRVVIGVDSDRARDVMQDVYRVLFLNETPFVVTDITSAEMIKYAANAFLAMKITFINQIANLCEAIGADVHSVAKGIGKDGRIGSKFLHPGPGYGGSCFPKDTRAIASTAAEYGCPLTLIEETIKANEAQKKRMVNKVVDALGENLRDIVIGVLGVTYKPNTDDMREAPALTILPELVKRGAKLRIYDPQGMKEAIWRFHEIRDSIEYVEDEYKAVTNVDVTILLTEWNQFRNLSLEIIKENMRGDMFFDFRNVYSHSAMRKHGFSYFSIGR